MDLNKKRNLSIAVVLTLLILPLYFISMKVEQGLNEKEMRRARAISSQKDKACHNLVKEFLVKPEKKTK